MQNDHIHFNLPPPGPFEQVLAAQTLARGGILAGGVGGTPVTSMTLNEADARFPAAKAFFEAAMVMRVAVGPSGRHFVFRDESGRIRSCFPIAEDSAFQDAARELKATLADRIFGFLAQAEPSLDFRSLELLEAFFKAEPKGLTIAEWFDESRGGESEATVAEQADPYGHSAGSHSEGDTHFAHAAMYSHIVLEVNISTAIQVVRPRSAKDGPGLVQFYDGTRWINLGKDSADLI